MKVVCQNNMQKKVVSRKFVYDLGSRTSRKFVKTIFVVILRIATYKMANLKLTYSKAFKTYQDLGIAKTRIANYKQKNDFESIRKILETNGVFLIKDTEKTILPSNPTVSLLRHLSFMHLSTDLLD